MPNVTKNYGLTKPFPEEFYDIGVHNRNMDIIDEMLGKSSSIVVSSEVPEDAEFWIDPDDEHNEGYTREEANAMFAKKSVCKTGTLLATNWAENVYSFENVYPKETYDISIEVAPNATVEQFEAFGEAMICGSADSNVATAIGDVPTIDIPIIVKAVKK